MTFVMAERPSVMAGLTGHPPALAELLALAVGLTVAIGLAAPAGFPIRSGMTFAVCLVLAIAARFPIGSGMTFVMAERPAVMAGLTGHPPAFAVGFVFSIVPSTRSAIRGLGRVCRSRPSRP